MSKYTKQDIIRIVEEEDVEFIRLQFTDMFGTLKNVAITSSQLEKALNNECMFDGSSIEGFVRIEESDMYLYPDLDTFVIFPWRPQQGKVARIICDIYTADRKPFEGDPRYALKKAVADAESMGYRFDVGPECEFFLFNQDEDGQPTTMSTERAGYFDLGPVDLGENARRDMVLTLEDMGYEIEASHHEVAPAQHEIDFKYDEALKTADNIMTFKLAVKTIAKRHGMFASFMPKPKYGVNGSGMHVNMSLSKEGRNIFDDPDGENGLSREAYWFIGGIMNHMRAMTAITNPLVNSYKRLVPGYEAPIYIAWSMTNRSPLIRIPVSRGSRTRVELRCPDSAANPYLTLAVCLEAGLDGIRRSYEEAQGLFEPICSSATNENTFSIPVKKEEKAAKSDCEEAGLTIVNAVRKNAFKELKQAFIALIYALPHEEELQIRYIHKIMLQAEMMLNDTYGMTEKLQKQFRNYYSNMESLTAAQAVDVSYKILGEAIEEREKYAESGENKCAKEYMTVALSYIGEHLQEGELSIVQVATQIYLNPVYFGRVFKNTFHMTFKKYLLQQRMEKAKRLIQDGCESIGTVCEQVGISNASYFSHLFKEYTGKLPSEYKKDYEE